MSEPSKEALEAACIHLGGEPGESFQTVASLRLADTLDAFAAARVAEAAKPTESDWERAGNICRDCAELPDRTSPDEYPDHLLVTPDELQPMVAHAIAEARAQERGAAIDALKAELDNLACPTHYSAAVARKVVESAIRVLAEQEKP